MLYCLFFIQNLTEYCVDANNFLCAAFKSYKLGCVEDCIDSKNYYTFLGKA